MLKRILGYSIVACLLFPISCIKEDISKDCTTGVEVQYYYRLNRYNTDLFGQQVHKMMIYIFDKNGLYYDSKFIDDPAQLQNDLPISLDLPTGDYTLVSWGGGPDWYQLGEIPSGSTTFQTGLRKGITTLSNFRLWIQYYLESGSANLIAQEPADLFHGVPTPITVSDNQQTHASIGLIKNTHKINLSITGINSLTPVPPGGNVPLDIYCTGNNGRYNHDNTFDVAAGSIKYLPAAKQVNGNVLTTSIKVMRLMVGHPIILTIADPGTGGLVYYGFDLLPYIMQSPAYQHQEDLDREEEFDVALKIGIDLQITIQINGWEIIHVIPQ